ncbi:hypothetical protein [Brevibacterium casei]|uniref:hypothetical protein n=1 Tax=Brevibacterium casei TaxID=33889 RepID=UPI00103AD5D1
MRILFQGAGAIGIAGAALFGDRHETVVVTRTPLERPQAVYPLRVGWFDELAHDGASGVDAALDAASTRRVTITDWAGIEEAGGFRLKPGSETAAADGTGVSVAEARRHWQRGRSRRARDRRIQDSWDLVVLTTRPGDLDEDVAAAIRAVAPRWVAITSQVDGDLEVARSLFPGAEVVVFGPAFLSERTTSHTVRYWTPLGATAFFVAGSAETVRRLTRALGSLVLPVPLEALLVPPAVFMPFVAELSIDGGEWDELLTHLRRPSDAAAEAVRAVTGVPVPILPAVARAVLELAERVSPIPMREYAGLHFSRHEGQTLAMLDGWIARAPEHAALTEIADGLRAKLAY